MRRCDLLAITATQQVREGHQGVNCLDGSSVYTQGVKGSGLFFEGDRSIEIYFKYTKQSLKGNWQVPFSFSKDYFQIEIGNGNNKLYFYDSTIYEYIDTLIIGNTYHIVVSMLRKVCTIYVNSIRKSEFETTKSIQNTFVIGRAVSGIDKYCPDIYLLRQYNYALTASQVKTLYNSGKPEEFVLPTSDKITFNGCRDYDNQRTYFTWDGSTQETYYFYPSCNNSEVLPKDSWWEVVVEVSNYVDGSPFLWLGGTTKPDASIPSANGTYTLILQSSGDYNTVGLYGGSQNTSRHLTLTLKSVRQVGCIAEYLPQNLMTAHDGDASDTTPIAWLDSAKQLPLNDEHLAPLLQSIGGYDLAVNGVPEIVQKPRL